MSMVLNHRVSIQHDKIECRNRGSFNLAVIKRRAIEERITADVHYPSKLKKINIFVDR